MEDDRVGVKLAAGLDLASAFGCCVVLNRLHCFRRVRVQLLSRGLPTLLRSLFFALFCYHFLHAAALLIGLALNMKSVEPPDEYCLGMFSVSIALRFVSSLQELLLAAYLLAQSLKQAWRAITCLRLAQGSWLLGLTVGVLEGVIFEKWYYNAEYEWCNPRHNSWMNPVLTATVFAACLTTYAVLIVRSCQRSPWSVAQRSHRRAASYLCCFALCQSLILPIFALSWGGVPQWYRDTALCCQACTGLFSMLVYASQGRYMRSWSALTDTDARTRQVSGEGSDANTDASARSFRVEVGHAELVEYPVVSSRSSFPSQSSGSMISSDDSQRANARSQ